MHAAAFLLYNAHPSPDSALNDAPSSTSLYAFAVRIIRDARDVSLAEFLHRRHACVSPGLHVRLRVPDLDPVDGFLSIQFDLLEADQQELGSAAWRLKNQSYLYHVTIGRIWDFDWETLVEAWASVQTCLHDQSGPLHGHLEGACMFHLGKTTAGLNSLFFGGLVERLHKFSDRLHRQDNSWVAMHASL